MENIEVLLKHYLWTRVKNPNTLIIWESDDFVGSYICQHVSNCTSCVMTEDITESVWEPVRNIIENKS